MNKRSSVLVSSPKSNTQSSLSLMELLNTYSKNRALPAQISAKKGDIDVQYTGASELKLVLDAKRASSINQLVGKIADLRDPDALESYLAAVTAKTASNFSRMQFFDNSAFVINSEDDKNAHAVKIEALFEAAQFGSARACQSLLEANEVEIIDLSDEDIQAIVETMIFWSVESKHAIQLEATKSLPELIHLPKAWNAVRAKPALYQHVLEVVYLDSGVKCQELIDANEAGTINLAPEELRALVKNQMDKYRVSADKVGQCVPQLRENKKAWAAMQAAPKESYGVLLEFFENQITRELLASLGFSTSEALIGATEANPGKFLGALEDKAYHEATHQVSEQDHAFANARVRVLEAMFALRHAVYALDQKEIYKMRPTIAKKIEDNHAKDQLAAAAIKARDEQNSKADEDDLANNPNPEERVKYIGEGQKGILAAFDTTKGEVLYEDRAKLEQKINEARRKFDKHNGKDATKAASAKHDLDRYSARLETAKKAYQDYLAHKQERADNLEALKEQKKKEANVRAQELQTLKDDEQALNDALKKSNPIAECIRFAFLAKLQDAYAFGVDTHDWNNLIITSLYEDAQAIERGDFAYEVIAASMMTKKQIIEAYPPILRDDAVAHARMLAILKSSSVQEFWLKMEDDLLDEQGQVVCQVLSNGHVDPLQALLNTSMALALLITVKQIAPAHNAEQAEFVRYNAILRTRLNKLANRSFEGAPTLLRNYILVALMAAGDKSALSRLLLKDQENSFLEILRAHKVDVSGYLEGNSKEEIKAMLAIEKAIEQLSNTQEQAITMADINNGYGVLEYLKAQLEQGGRATEIDFLIIECFCYTIHAQYMEYCKEHGQAKTKSNPILFTNEAAARRSQRAKEVKEEHSAENVIKGTFTSSVLKEERILADKKESTLVSVVPVVEEKKVEVPVKRDDSAISTLFADIHKHKKDEFVLVEAKHEEVLVSKKELTPVSVVEETKVEEKKTEVPVEREIIRRESEDRTDASISARPDVIEEEVPVEMTRKAMREADLAKWRSIGLPQAVIDQKDREKYPDLAPPPVEAPKAATRFSVIGTKKSGSPVSGPTLTDTLTTGLATRRSSVIDEVVNKKIEEGAMAYYNEKSKEWLSEKDYNEYMREKQEAEENPDGFGYEGPDLSGFVRKPYQAQTKDVTTSSGISVVGKVKASSALLGLFGGKSPVTSNTSTGVHDTVAVVPKKEEKTEKKPKMKWAISSDEEADRLANEALKERPNLANLFAPK